MALVIRAGFFCTCGHTELGARFRAPEIREDAAIDEFLRKLDGIEWVRLFPAREKPGKFKPGGVRVSFKDAEDGLTGARLVDRMKSQLGKYCRRSTQASKLDVIVLIDDADCRFLQEGAFERWTEDLEQNVRAVTERPELHFIPLLASPEIEAWLLADWEEGFGREYAAIHVPLRRALEHDILGSRPWTSIESFGGPYVNGSCTQKLSDEVNKVLGELAKAATEKGGSIERSTYTYSKSKNGPDMLRRVRPEKIADVCRSVFRPAYLKLLALVPPAGAGR